MTAMTTPTPAPGRPLRKYFIRGFLAVFAFFVIGTALLLWDGLHDEIGVADLGVVLGNTVYPDGTPSPRLAARLDRTLELYHQGAFPRILVSGAIGKEGKDEAVVMRDYLVARGVPSALVLVDSDGRTTFATAKNTRAIMDGQGLQSIFIVSQYFHVPRTKLAMRRFGIKTVYSAHAYHFEGRDLYSIPRELIGYVRFGFAKYDMPAKQSSSGAEDK